MQEAIPYKTWLPMAIKDNPFSSTIKRSAGRSPVSSVNSLRGANGDLTAAVKENAVIVIGRRGCCMSHVVTRLLLGLGVNPPVYNVDEADENDAIEELKKSVGSGPGEGGSVQLPVVFIGGQLFGGLDRVMSTHITGELTPILKKAGALWL